MKKKNFQAIVTLILLGLMLWGTSFNSVNAGETLQITGEVTRPITITLQELKAMPQTTVNAPLYCYGELVTSGDWTGVQLRALLEMAEYNKNAQSIQFDAEDGYSITILVTEALREDVIIAYEKDGQPEDLRLVIPGANGNLWISMITSLTLIKGATATEEAPFKPSEILQPTPQQSTSQQSQQPTILQPTPEPQATPAPSTSPSPTAISINEKVTTPGWLVIAVSGFVLTLACTSLLIYFKKRRR